MAQEDDTDDKDDGAATRDVDASDVLLLSTIALTFILETFHLIFTRILRPSSPSWFDFVGHCSVPLEVYGFYSLYHSPSSTDRTKVSLIDFKTLCVGLGTLGTSSHILLFTLRILFPLFRPYNFLAASVFLWHVGCEASEPRSRAILWALGYVVFGSVFFGGGLRVYLGIGSAGLVVGRWCYGDHRHGEMAPWWSYYSWGLPKGRKAKLGRENGTEGTTPTAGRRTKGRPKGR